MSGGAAPLLCIFNSSCCYADMKTVCPTCTLQGKGPVNVMLSQRQLLSSLVLLHQASNTDLHHHGPQLFMSGGLSWKACVCAAQCSKLRRPRWTRRGCRAAAPAASCSSTLHRSSKPCAAPMLDVLCTPDFSGEKASCSSTLPRCSNLRRSYA